MQNNFILLIDTNFSINTTYSFSKIVSSDENKSIDVFIFEDKWDVIVADKDVLSSLDLNKYRWKPLTYFVLKFESLNTLDL